jgi:predicted nucleic acid-binding protein
MKKILIDLNVLLDFLDKRNDHLGAAKIIDLCIDNKIKGYLCAHEITTLAYFLTKNRHINAKSIIGRILDIFSIISVTEAILRDALNSRIKDYEDAVIESSCVKNEIKYIVSRDLKDFKNSRIKAISPQEYITEYKLLLGNEKN